jgi:phosphoglycolate phosphatase-like HAD superfamily hydrolase
VILWDIDGTLVNSRASRADKHVKAAEVFLGRELPTHERSAGKTDRQIIFELLQSNRTETRLAAVAVAETLKILDSLSIEEIRRYPVLCNPGVMNALEMASSTGWVNGLLTGNTPVRARAKLESAGILEVFDQNYAYFGHQAPSRGDLVAASASAIRSAGYSIVVIGDTPLDILSAQEHELKVIAVATGPYSAAELSELHPDLLLENWTSGWTSLADFLNSVHT